MVVVTLYSFLFLFERKELRRFATGLCRQVRCPELQFGGYKLVLFRHQSRKCQCTMNREAKSTTNIKQKYIYIYTMYVSLPAVCPWDWPQVCNSVAGLPCHSLLLCVFCFVCVSLFFLLLVISVFRLRLLLGLALAGCFLCGRPGLLRRFWRWQFCVSCVGKGLQRPEDHLNLLLLWQPLHFFSTCPRYHPTGDVSKSSQEYYP